MHKTPVNIRESPVAWVYPNSAMTFNCKAPDLPMLLTLDNAVPNIALCFEIDAWLLDITPSMKNMLLEPR